ncbi:hypothetical protein ACWGI9_44395 [Streptomyces sp. NPDC054833]
MSVTNRQIRLAAHPVGVVKPEDWEHCSGPVEEPGPGRFAGRTRVISLDPAMRGWLDDRPSYLPPVAIGEVMRAGSVIEVTDSNHPVSSRAITWSAPSASRSTWSPTGEAP